jgi:ABC-2 type transport system ATP-binding protein
MKQRIGIAQVLLGDPKFLILDEPTVGLDPEERVRFRNLLAELSGERIVILSSHIVSDIETMAGDIAIVFRGRLLEHSFAPEKGRLEDTYLRVIAQAKNDGNHVF